MLASSGGDEMSIETETVVTQTMVTTRHATSAAVVQITTARPRLGIRVSVAWSLLLVVKVDSLNAINSPTHENC